MSEIIICGSTGMLGSYCSKHFENIGFRVIPFPRNLVVANTSEIELWLKEKATPNTIVLNCAGVIKSEIDRHSIIETLKVNSIFPHALVEAGARLIQVTTDCVFSGLEGGYNEDSPHDALDLYGRSKSLGEPAQAQVIRTSIIGEDPRNRRSLIEWAKKNSGQEVNGYVNHIWNGVTCLQLAKVVEQIIVQGLTWEGVRHIFSPKKVTKFELLSLISNAFSLNLKIVPFQTEVPVYRDLASKHTPSFSIPDLKEQLSELAGFYK